MKKNELIIFIFCLTISFCAINIANAQWALPNPATFNLPGGSINQMIQNLTNWLLGIVTAVCVVFLIWGGINYVSSSGDTEKAQTAKRVIKYALMGAIIAGVAYALVNVIFSKILI